MGSPTFVVRTSHNYIIFDVAPIRLLVFFSCMPPLSIFISRFLSLSLSVSVSLTFSLSLNLDKTYFLMREHPYNRPLPRPGRQTCRALSYSTFLSCKNRLLQNTTTFFVGAQPYCRRWSPSTELWYVRYTYCPSVGQLVVRSVSRLGRSITIS